jgi:hypothetical protein
MDETLVEVKLSDIIRANRSRVTNPKKKKQTRRNNHLARRNRRKNLRSGHVNGKQ